MKKTIFGTIIAAAFLSIAYAAEPTFFRDLLVSSSIKIGGTGLADSKSALEINSTTKGLLLPRLTTTQRDAISSPPAGLMVYNTTTGFPNYYNSGWKIMNLGDFLKDGSVSMTGDLTFNTGASTYVQTADVASGTSKAMFISTGYGTAANASSGNVNVQSGLPDGDGDSGWAAVYSSDTSPGGGDTGDVFLFAGQADDGTAGSAYVYGGSANSGTPGDVYIYPGTKTGGKGKIYFQNADEGTSGYIWTSTDTNGAGHWAAAASSGANVNLSNLSSPTAINQYLIFDMGADAIIKTKNAAAATWSIFLKSGDVTSAGSFASGNIDVVTGSAANTNQNSGNLTLSSGPGGSLGTGNVILKSGGSAAGGPTGDTSVKTGDAGGGDSGSVIFRTGTATGTRGTIQFNGHVKAAGSAPTISSCGSSPAIAGTDVAGRATVGTGGVATSCTITFNQAFATAPTCVVGDESTSLLLKGTASTTALVITAAAPFSASDLLVYHCIEY